VTKHTSRGHLIPHVLRQLFRKSQTRDFPFGPMQIHEAYKGQVQVDIGACVGCGQCARGCPSEAISVERLDKRGVRVTLLHERCGNCGLCAEACPRDAIRLTAEFVAPATAREDLVQVWERPGEESQT